MEKKIFFRVPRLLEDAIKKRAVAEDKTVSELLREIVENFLSGGEQKNSGFDQESAEILRKNFAYIRTLAKLILDTDLRTYAMRSGLTVADKMQLDAEIQKRKKVFVEKLEKLHARNKRKRREKQCNPWFFRVRQGIHKFQRMFPFFDLPFDQLCLYKQTIIIIPEPKILSRTLFIKTKIVG